MLSTVTKKKTSSIMECVTPCGAESWMMNKDTHRKLLATEMGVWRRCVRRTFWDKFLNDVIREEVEVEKRIIL
jgi:hypothetical protein